MNLRALTYLLTTTLLLAGLLITLANSPEASIEKIARLRHNDVRGSAILYKEQHYTLNFDQQNQLIDYLNGAVAADENSKNAPPAGFTQIEIYLFSSPAPLIIYPLHYQQGELLFKHSEWYQGRPLRTVSNGQAVQLLNHAYVEE